MARSTLADLAKLNPDPFVRGIIEEALASTPELRVAVARTIPGTDYRTVVRTGLPATGFRDANEGVEASVSTFENRTCRCFILAARVEVDQAIADAFVDGPSAYQSIETVGVLESAYRKAGFQFYYGTDADGKGFPGLIASYDADNKTVDAGATTAKTSVWFVKFGERDVQFVFGEHTPLRVSDWRVESLADGDGKKFPGYVSDLSSWIGLQFVNKHSAVRVKNLGTTNGTTFSDDRAFEALAKFPVGVTPDVCFMNRRSLEQLRKSRTNVTSATGVPSLPDSVAGIPIVITDSIVNTEA
jgi:hypothetical protein